jgi:protein N-terminal amidase
MHRIGANSAVVYGPDGVCVGGYRKTNLFEVDKCWAKPGFVFPFPSRLLPHSPHRSGTGFATFHLPPPLNVLTLGICMDLNPQPPAQWTLADGPYELADHCVQTKTDVLVCLNAWLDSERRVEEERDEGTLWYWSARLRPLWARDYDDAAQMEQRREKHRRTVVVLCNRSGEENGAVLDPPTGQRPLKSPSSNPT